MKLTKSDILNGAKTTRDVPIKALDGEVTIRALTDGEYAEVEALMASAVELDVQTDDINFSSDGASNAPMNGRVVPKIDIGRFAEAEINGHRLAAAKGLSVNGEEWSVEEVASLPPGAPKEIAERVYELSGASPEQEEVLRMFREDGDGAAHTDAESERRTVGS